MTGFTERAWLAVASGGRWDLDEVRKEMGDVSAKRVQETLWQMEKRGAVTKFEDGCYGVTHDCTIPQGLTVAEVLRALGVEA